MRKNRFLSLTGAVLIFLASCNLSDFKTDKLIEPSDLKPMLYMPLAYGTFLVKDYTSGLPLGNTPVVLPRVDFIPQTYDLQGLNFAAAAIDSMVIVVKTVNETPMKLGYVISFQGGIPMDSDTLHSALLNSNGDVLEAVSDSVEFYLNKSETVALGSSPNIQLNISLFQPDKGTVFSSVLKNAMVSVKIGFRAPVNLAKLKR